MRELSELSMEVIVRDVAYKDWKFLDIAWWIIVALGIVCLGFARDAPAYIGDLICLAYATIISFVTNECYRAEQRYEDAVTALKSAMGS